MAGYDRIVARAFGGPEVLRIEHVDALPEPRAGEARIRVEAAGIGYTDTILRRGRYIAYTGGLPVTPGYDMVGIVDAVGPGVSAFRPGDRVADMPVFGSYSEFLVRPVQDLVPVPPGVDPTAAIEVPLMWVTAWQMLTRCVSLPAGATILVVGAGGSVGRGLVLLACHLGFSVIGTCSPAHFPLVRSMGAIALDRHRADLPAAVRDAAGETGIAAAFDAIGGASWEASWAALRAGGTLVGYGFQDFLESDAPSAEAGAALFRLTQGMNEEGNADGSKRSTMFYDIQQRRNAMPDDYRADAAHLLALMASGIAKPAPAEPLPLDQAATAHRRIAAGGLDHRLVLRP